MVDKIKHHCIVSRIFWFFAMIDLLNKILGLTVSALCDTYEIDMLTGQFTAGLKENIRNMSGS
jgi:hypothetical protein